MARINKLMLAVVIIIMLLVIVFLIRSPEDSWIKDEKGVYVKHGNPSQIPDYVEEQKEAISCALDLYKREKNSGMQFNSQCLGVCYEYAVNVVHVSRNEEDNKIENQCSDYRKGKVSKFIELDKEGNIIRVL